VAIAGNYDAQSHYLEHQLAPISIVPWTEKIVTNTSLRTKVAELTPDKLINLCSPKISNLDSYNMSIFSIRICVTDSAFSGGTWLKDDTVKTALEAHRVELNISNSTCDSGRMVAAGAILLKHPQFTHRLYYLLSLRRQLPANTPFFDIGLYKRTDKQVSKVHTWLLNAARIAKRH
jgi:hypothetical protein